VAPGAHLGDPLPKRRLGCSRDPVQRPHGNSRAVAAELRERICKGCASCRPPASINCGAAVPRRPSATGGFHDPSHPHRRRADHPGTEEATQSSFVVAAPCRHGLCGRWASIRGIAHGLRPDPVGWVCRYVGGNRRRADGLLFVAVWIKSDLPSRSWNLRRTELAAAAHQDAQIPWPRHSVRPAWRGRPGESPGVCPWFDAVVEVVSVILDTTLREAPNEHSRG
jgi:hypothetical protein